MIPKNLQATRRLQTPTLIGCSLLMNHRTSAPEPSPQHLLFSTPPRSAEPRIMTQLLVNSQTSSGKFSDPLTTSRVCPNPRSAPAPQHLHSEGLRGRNARLQQRAAHGRSPNKSLTMTYFHTGIRTIIGAKAFHCPVRDGKEWYHLAMVVRHNGVLACLVGGPANS